MCLILGGSLGARGGGRAYPTGYGPAQDQTFIDGITTRALTTQVESTGLQRIGGPGAAGQAEVAVIDTGIDPTHPDLNVVGGVDCIDDGVTGWADDNGHGTHVAGIIGAKDNTVGVVGVAPGVRLWAVKALDANGMGSNADIACGFRWVLRHPNIRAVNLSLRLADCSAPFDPYQLDPAPATPAEQACEEAITAIHTLIGKLTARGTAVIVAAGNDGTDTKYAQYLDPLLTDPGVIVVGSLADYDGQAGGAGVAPNDGCAHVGQWWAGDTVDRDDQYASYSNYGQDVTILAPGTCILSTFPGNRYAYLTGTSMATPFVTGAVATYLATHATATNDQVIHALVMSGLTTGSRVYRHDTDSPWLAPVLNIPSLEAEG